MAISGFYCINKCIHTYGLRCSIPGGRIYFSWFNFVSTSIGGAMLYIAYLFIKAKKDAALEKERKREIGKTMIGGTFELLDHTGKTVTDADFKVFILEISGRIGFQCLP